MQNSSENCLISIVIFWTGVQFALHHLPVFYGLNCAGNFTNFSVITFHFPSFFMNYSSLFSSIGLIFAILQLALFLQKKSYFICGKIH